MEDCHICLLDLEKRQEETSLKVNCQKPQYIQFLQNNLPKEFYVCFKYLLNVHKNNICDLFSCLHNEIWCLYESNEGCNPNLLYH